MNKKITKPYKSSPVTRPITGTLKLGNLATAKNRAAKRQIRKDAPLDNSDAIPGDIRARIADVFNPEFVEEWWTSPIASLANLSPLELFASGKKDAIVRELGRIEHGLPV